MVTFEVLNNHRWPLSTLLGSKGAKHWHHRSFPVQHCSRKNCRLFCSAIHKENYCKLTEMSQLWRIKYLFISKIPFLNDLSSVKLSSWVSTETGKQMSDWKKDCIKIKFNKQMIKWSLNHRWLERTIIHAN